MYAHAVRLRATKFGKKIHLEEGKLSWGSIAAYHRNRGAWGQMFSHPCRPHIVWRKKVVACWRPPLIRVGVLQDHRARIAQSLSKVCAHRVLLQWQEMRRQHARRGYSLKNDTVSGPDLNIFPAPFQTLDWSRCLKTCAFRHIICTWKNTLWTTMSCHRFSNLKYGGHPLMKAPWGLRSTSLNPAVVRRASFTRILVSK